MPWINTLELTRHPQGICNLVTFTEDFSVKWLINKNNEKIYIHQHNITIVELEEGNKYNKCFWVFAMKLSEFQGNCIQKIKIRREPKHNKLMVIMRT